MELAADINQLLWSLFVPMVTAFQCHSTMKGLTRATGKVMSTFFFCLVSGWSKSRMELKGFSRRWRLSLLYGLYWSGGSELPYVSIRAVCTG